MSLIARARSHAALLRKQGHAVSANIMCEFADLIERKGLDQEAPAVVPLEPEEKPVAVKGDGFGTRRFK